jgi:hypothetical protein
MMQKNKGGDSVERASRIIRVLVSITTLLKTKRNCLALKKMIKKLVVFLVLEKSEIMIKFIRIIRKIRNI